MAIWTGFINVCNCLGAAAGYLIICGQVFSVLTGADGHWRRYFVLLVGLFVCAPLALARQVSFMRYLAMLSIAAIMLLVVTVVAYFGEYGADGSVDHETLWVGPGGAPLFTYMNTVNIVIFSYNNQFNVPQLTSELAPEPRTGKMTAVSLISTATCFVLYALVALFGTLVFGVAGNQKDTVILDLHSQRRNPLVVVTLLAVMFSVLMCFQFHIYPIRQFLAYVVRKARGRGADGEGEDAQYWGTSLTRWIDMVCALLAVVFAILIAIAVTQLRTVLDLIGAFAGAWVSYVIPPLFIIQIRRMKGSQFAWLSPEILFCLAFFGLGAFLFVFGTYSAIAA
mmetsp:Transcript_8391/g.25443  ORF Transcript_8391/g.25443 Transcript_8391/m.25443 type:complete len:338 (+) Transcript_8391:397-1410(+)